MVPAAIPPSGPIPASAFASRSAFQAASLSPDGKLIAMRMSKDDHAVLVLLHPETREVLQVIPAQGDQTFEWFSWANPDRLLFSVSQMMTAYGEEQRVSRLLSFDVSAKHISRIGWTAGGVDGDEVIFTDPAGRYVLITQQKTIYEYPSVIRYSLEPAARADRGTVVQAAKQGVWSWFADDAGTVRLGFEPTSDKKLKVWYRSAAETPLKLIAKMGKDDFEQGIRDIVRIVSGSDEGYVIDKADGRLALRKFNYATRTAGEVVYRNPEWDLTEATIGTDGKPVAAYFTDDKDRVVWLDEKMKTLQAKLERAMPDQDVWIGSRATDGSRMLVYVGREDDPGSLYVYTAANRSLALFTDLRPELTGRTLARGKAIAYTARDGTRIHGYLTLPAASAAAGTAAKRLPLIIMPHGGPYGVRDVLGYEDEVQFLASRGYAVLQPNYRGSDGYGEAFEDLGRGQIGRHMQDDLDDAMDWAVKDGVADAKRVCVVGASYGGYAALWSVIRNPERYRCAASFAGVTDWNRQLRYDKRFFDREGNRKWNIRTRGDDATFDFDTVSPARQVARLTRPVLLAHGDKDANVPFSQFKLMRDAALVAKAPVETLILPGEGHGFDKPADEQRWYETLAAFLAKHNPAD